MIIYCNISEQNESVELTASPSNSRDITIGVDINNKNSTFLYGSTNKSNKKNENEYRSERLLFEEKLISSGYIPLKKEFDNRCRCKDVCLGFWYIISCQVCSKKSRDFWKEIVIPWWYDNMLKFSIIYQFTML